MLEVSRCGVDMFRRTEMVKKPAANWLRFALFLGCLSVLVSHVPPCAFAEEDAERVGAVSEDGEETLATHEVTERDDTAAIADEGARHEAVTDRPIAQRRTAQQEDTQEAASQTDKVASTDDAKVEEIKTHLEETQKVLTSLKEKLPETAKREASPRQAFVKTYVSLFVSCLEERRVEVKEGLQEVGQRLRDLFRWHVSGALWAEIGAGVLALAGTTLLGILLAMASARWMHSLLRGVFRWALAELEARPRLQSTVSLGLDVLVASLPVLIMFVVQVSTFFLIEPSFDLRNAMLAFASGVCLWLLVWRLKDVVFHHIPTWALGTHPQKNKRSMLFSLQFFLVFWVVGDWLIALFNFADLSLAAETLVRLVFGVGMTISAMTFVRLLRRPLWRWIKANQENQFPLLTTVFWLFWNNFPVVLYGLFVLDDGIFHRFFSPILLTTLLLPVIPLMFVFLKRLRMQYLWVYRRSPHKGFWYRLLKPRQQAYRLFYVVIYALVGGFIIQLWDVRFFTFLKEVVGGQTYDQLADIALLGVIAWAIVHFGDRVLRHYLEKRAAGAANISFYAKGRLRTLLVTSQTVLRITVFVTCILVVFSKLGYNITPVITNLGWLSVVLGWGLQSFIKDYFSGLFILLDNNVVLGDWVDIDGKLGIVEELSLRTIKVRADSGTLMTIPFGSIKVLGNRSRTFSSFVINLPLPYETTLEAGKKLLEETYQRLKRLPAYRKKIVYSLDIRGFNDIFSYACVLQAKLKTNPAEQEFVRRGFNKVLKEVMDEEGIKIPTPPYPSAWAGPLSPSRKPPIKG